MANEQKVIAGLPEVHIWEIQYEIIINGTKKKTLNIIVQGATEGGARHEAVKQLKAGPPFKIKACRLWQAETL